MPLVVCLFRQKTAGRFSGAVMKHHVDRKDKGEEEEEEEDHDDDDDD